MNRINLAESIPLESPLVVHLELTNKCNFRCNFCPESLPDYPLLSQGYHSLTFADYTKIINNIKKSFKKISSLRLWIMGEPLLNKNIFDMIKLARHEDIAHSIEITTNASLLNEEKSIKLVKSELDLCKISIYGSNDIQMAELTNTHYKSDQILRQISDLVNLRNEENSNLKIMAKTVTTSEDVDMHKYMERIEQIVDYTEINTEHSWTDSSESSTSSQKSVCAFPFYTLAIHSDGQVSPCCVDWSKRSLWKCSHRKSV